MSELRRVSPGDFMSMIKERGLFREDDVTFDNIEGGNHFIYEGDDFTVDAEAIAELELEGLLIIGNLKTDLLDINDILSDYGVVCVSGDVTCENFFYATESTGVVIGGNLVVNNVFYADCGNSVLQVNGDFVGKHVCVSQASVEVLGVERFEEKTTDEVAEALGLTFDEYANEAIVAYFGELHSKGA